MRWADDVWPMRWSDDVWPMRWAYDAVYSWLDGVLSVRAYEVSCRVRAGEVAQSNDCFRVETSSASPQGAASGSKVRFRWTGWVPRLHPRCFVGVPAQRMELGAKGRGKAHRWETRLAWDTTVTCDADHVTCFEINVSCSGKLWNASKTPRHVGISPGPDCPLPVCSHFVIISLCDVHHNHPRAKGGNTVQSGPH
jgi:hypothetical protein